MHVHAHASTQILKSHCSRKREKKREKTYGHAHTETHTQQSEQTKDIYHIFSSLRILKTTTG